MSTIYNAIEKAEAFLVLGIGDEAWETLEDLPTEVKNVPRVLELRLESLVCLRSWEKAEIIPQSVSVWLSQAREIKLLMKQLICR